MPATRRVSLFSKSFPSFSFFLPLFPLFRAPFSGDFFFLFFVRVLSLGLQKEVHFFLSFWCEKTFVCILFFIFSTKTHSFLSSSSRACRRRRRRRIIIIIALFVGGVGEKTLFETL